MNNSNNIPPVRRGNTQKTAPPGGDNTASKKPPKKVRFHRESSDRTAKSKIQPEVRDKIYDRVARQEKAYRIVVRLIDNPVSASLFKRCLPYVNQDTYNDIVDERSIVKNCGYPICNAPLPPCPPRQTFKIDPVRRKVYRLEERNKFCSDTCFTVSRELRDGLSAAPVWMMPRGCHDNIRVIPVTTMTKEVQVEEALPKNEKIDERYMKESGGGGELKKDGGEGCVHPGDPNTRISSFPEVRRDPLMPVSRVHNISAVISQQFAGLGLDSEEEDDDGGSERSSSISNDNSTPSLSQEIRKVFSEWTSSISSCPLSSLKPSRDEDSDDNSTDTDDDLLDDDLKPTSTNPRKPRQPMPSITELLNTTAEGGVNITEHNPDSVIVLPRIDSIHGAQQRQHIVLTNIQRSANRILHRWKSGYSDVSSHIVDLVRRFNLTKDNSMHSERVWTGISGILLLEIFPEVRRTLPGVSDEEFISEVEVQSGLTATELKSLLAFLH